MTRQAASTWLAERLKIGRQVRYRKKRRNFRKEHNLMPPAAKQSDDFGSTAVGIKRKADHGPRRNGRKAGKYEQAARSPHAAAISGDPDVVRSP